MLLEVHNMDIQLCCFLARIYICLVGRINQPVFINSSLQMFSMRVGGK